MRFSNHISLPKSSTPKTPAAVVRLFCWQILLKCHISNKTVISFVISLSRQLLAPTKYVLFLQFQVHANELGQLVQLLQDIVVV